jgi:hypothetical protein
LEALAAADDDAASLALFDGNTALFLGRVPQKTPSQKHNAFSQHCIPLPLNARANKTHGVGFGICYSTALCSCACKTWKSDSLLGDTVSCWICFFGFARGQGRSRYKKSLGLICAAIAKRGK